MRQSHWVLGALLLLTSACGPNPEQTRAEETSEQPEPVEPGEATLVAEPVLEVREQAPGTPAPEPEGEAVRNDESTAEPRAAVLNLASCLPVRERPATLYTGAGPLAALTVNDAVFTAGYIRRGGRDEVIVTRIQGNGAARTVARGVLGESGSRGASAPPALIAEPGSDRIQILAVDGTSRLLRSATVIGARGAALAFTEIATAVDSRFAPALITRGSEIAAAWTQSGTPMKLSYSPSLLASPMSVQDLVPVGGSASHPTFHATNRGIELYSVDARVGVSVLHRYPIRSNGSVMSPEVARPLLNLANPPQFEISLAGGEPHVAYAAVGSMATAAVGIVALAQEGRLRPLSRGRGYGWVFVAAASDGRRSLFALVKPDGEGRQDPRKLVLRQYDGERLGPEQELVLGENRAQHVAIAHLGENDFAVAYTAGAAAEAVVFRCAD